MWSVGRRGTCSIYSPRSMCAFNSKHAIVSSMSTTGQFQLYRSFSIISFHISMIWFKSALNPIIHCFLGHDFKVKLNEAVNKMKGAFICRSPTMSVDSINDDSFIQNSNLLGSAVNSTGGKSVQSITSTWNKPFFVAVGSNKRIQIPLFQTTILTVSFYSAHVKAGYRKIKKSRIFNVYLNRWKLGETLTLGKRQAWRWELLLVIFLEAITSSMLAFFDNRLLLNAICLL